MKKITLLLCCSFALFSCFNKQSPELDVENKISKNIVPEIHTSFFNNSEKAQDLKPENPDNLSKINGYRGLKLNSQFTDFDFSKYDVNIIIDKGDTLKEVPLYFYEIEKTLSYNEVSMLKLGNGKIFSSSLIYLNNKLKNITLNHFEKIRFYYFVEDTLTKTLKVEPENYIDYSNHSLIDIYLNVFGKPNATFYKSSNEKIICTGEIKDCLDKLAHDVTDETKLFGGVFKPVLDTPSFKLEWKTEKIRYKIYFQGDKGFSDDITNGEAKVSATIEIIDLQSQNRIKDMQLANNKLNLENTKLKEVNEEKRRKQELLKEL